MGMYAIFGFDAVAFKIAQYALLIVNLGLAWCVFRKVLGETRLALFATLLIAYHAAESELYYNFGTIYELLCFTFVLCGVAYWINSRRDGVVNVIRRWRIAIGDENLNTFHLVCDSR